MNAQELLETYGKAATVVKAYYLEKFIESMVTENVPENYKEFASRLQFVQALVDYCSPAQSNESLKKQTHYQAFMHWLSSRKRMFPELSYHLKECK